MDHPFPTHRPALTRATEGLSLVADALAIASLDAKDRARLLARREPEISDFAARAALARRAGRLGLLLEDVDATLPSTTAPLLTPHKDAWTRFLSTGTSSLPPDTLRALEAAAEALRAQHASLAPLDGEDAGSSSLSDYSDSETQSTEEGEEEGSSEEESEED